MAGYTRQSAASIINGENITAPPINAEFNTLQDAFSGSTGHAHDGTTGNGPKIDLATSVSGFLPAASGGLGGKNNYAATSDPTVGDDINDGYAVGSVWYNVPDDRYYVCVYNVAGAAVWLENRFINSSGDFAPHANNTKDLGHTLKRWKDLFLSGNADIDGSLNVATTTYLGGILTVNANAIFNVGTTTTISNIDVASGAIDNAAIGTTVAAAGTFTTLSATTSLTAATADINGGSIDGATVGANSHSTGKFTTLESTGLATLNSVNIDGGAIDGAVIGANSAVAGSFTTISSAGQATLASVDINGGAIDGATIGATSASTITGTTITGTSLVGPVTGNLTGNSSGTHTGPVTGAVTGNLTGNVSSSGTSTFNNVTIDGTLNMNAGTSATITNLSAPTNDNDAARKVDVDNAVANLVDSAPGTLDTLNELAAALGDDPDFATTITNSIATKLPLAGGTMTGAIAMSTNKITGVGDPTAAQDVSNKAYTDQQDALQVTKSGDSMSGNLAMGSNNITGLATPTANDHASNKSYVDGLFQSTQAAATSASNAATSESNAATSETNASNSATAAASSASSAAASLDSFDDRYLGAKSSAPTVDNDGDALVIGALYFNSTTNIMNVYGSGGWQSAGSAVNGTSDRQTYIVTTAGQTVFAATYDAGYIDVYLNGVKQLMGTDVTATNGTSVVFASGTAINDIVDIVAYGTFVLADHLTQTQSDARYVNLSGDTMTGNLDVGGTVTADGLTVETASAPKITVSENTGTGTASIDFVATAAFPKTRIVTDIAAGNLSLETLGNDRLKIANNGDISFYDTSGNAKFFWDASAVRLGVGTDTPSRVAELYNTSNPALRINNGTDVADIGLASSAGALLTGSTSGALVLSRGGANAINLGTNGQNRVTIDSSGLVGIGTSSPAAKMTIAEDLSGPLDATAFRLNASSANDSNTLFGGPVSSGNYSFFQSYKEGTSAGVRALALNPAGGNVGIGTSSPDATLELSNSSVLPSISLGRTPYSSHGSLTIGGTLVGALTSNTDKDDNSTVNVGASKFLLGNGDTRFYQAGSATAGSARTFNESMRIDSNGALLLGATSRSVYYNSVNVYNASAVIKTNVSNEVADLVITNGNNDFGSSVDFARTNSAGNDVRFATISAQPTNTTAGSEAGVIRFYTKGTGDSNVVERMRILADGGITFNGDTAAANALNDYEELTQTVTLTSAGGSITLDNLYNSLSFTKIGRVVQVSGRIRVSSVSSPSGSVYLTLPYIIQNQTDHAGFASLHAHQHDFALPSNSHGMFWECSEGTNKAYLTILFSTGQWSGGTAGSIFVGSPNDQWLYVSGTYTTA